jgi:hypothetical protein
MGEKKSRVFLWVTVLESLSRQRTSFYPGIAATVPKDVWSLRS